MSPIKKTNSNTKDTDLDRRLALLEKIIVVGNGEAPWLSRIPVIETQLASILDILNSHHPAIAIIPVIQEELKEIQSWRNQLAEKSRGKMLENHAGKWLLASVCLSVVVQTIVNVILHPFASYLLREI